GRQPSGSTRWDGSVVSSLHCMNDPNRRGHMASYIGRRKFLALLGGAAAWPLAARAQQGGKIPTVGYLWHAGSPREEVPYFDALLEGFARLGYVDGRNIKLEHRFPNETPERFKSMAAELVSLNVDVLMGGAVASPYLRDATTKIPIVFMFVPDPVGMKLVQSIARARRECTDHVIVFNEDHLRCILSKYASYYNEVRTHLSLGKDAPCTRRIEWFGDIIAQPILGGLHHRYARI